MNVFSVIKRKAPTGFVNIVLRRLESIFTSVYAAVQKLKKDSWKELQFSLVDNSKLNVVNNANENGGNGNGGNGNGGNNNGCTYKEFLACKPRDFDGKRGAIALTRWIEKMESVMGIIGCVNNQKLKYASSSLINKALNWWNTQIQARGRDVALGMTWEDFKALLMEEFCLSNEVEKLELEFWNHAIVGANHAVYNNRFMSWLNWFHTWLLLNLSLGVEHCQRVLRIGRRLKDQASKEASGLIIRGIRNNENQERGRAFNVNAIEARQDPNIVTGTFSLSDHYAIVLFDSGANFSFVSTKFVPLLNVKPSILRPTYVIEVANGKKVETDRIIRGCFLELGYSLFTIDLIPFGHGSFDVIVDPNP
ncbi:reverse transcriptase domain-containing protein [Tanacetum coccineum]